MTHGISGKILMLKAGIGRMAVLTGPGLGGWTMVCLAKQRMTLVVCRTADTASVLFVNKISCKKTKRRDAGYPARS